MALERRTCSVSLIPKIAPVAHQDVQQSRVSAVALMMVPIALLLFFNPLVLCTLHWTGVLHFAPQLLAVVLVALSFLLCLLAAFCAMTAISLQVGIFTYREVVAARTFRRRPIRDALRVASTFRLNQLQRVYFGIRLLVRSKLWTMGRRVSPRPLTLITGCHLITTGMPTNFQMLGMIIFLGLRLLDYHHRYLCRPLSVLLCALGTIHLDYSPMVCLVVFLLPSFPKKRVLCATCHGRNARDAQVYDGALQGVLRSSKVSCLQRGRP